MNEFNGVMMQYFHWYTEADGSLWKQLENNASALAEAGITSVWLPPAYKGAAGGYDVGYGVYDLFDLGEFDQKGSVRTKYGTRNEYLEAIKAVQKAGIQVYADIVFNHKLGADQSEEFKATPFNPENRNEPVGELQTIIRFDAVKHVESRFFLDWLMHLSEHSGRRLFAVGEYWSEETEALKHFLNMTDHTIMLFDVKLHYNFAQASKLENNFNLQTIFDNTLVKDHPILAVTIVSNHDTQPLQSLESVVEAWFKPLAYALILLRREGYPCVFAADYYGAHYKDTGKDGNQHEVWIEKHQWLIDLFLKARRNNAYGDQYDYFDHPNCIGWTRTGNDKNPGGMAVILSNGEDGTKYMETSYPNTTYYDLTMHVSEPIVTNQDGWGEFRCNGRSVSVWVPK